MRNFIFMFSIFSFKRRVVVLLDLVNINKNLCHSKSGEWMLWPESLVLVLAILEIKLVLNCVNCSMCLINYNRPHDKTYTMCIITLCNCKLVLPKEKPHTPSYLYSEYLICIYSLEHPNRIPKMF